MDGGGCATGTFGDWSGSDLLAVNFQDQGTQGVYAGSDTSGGICFCWRVKTHVLVLFLRESDLWTRICLSGSSREIGAPPSTSCLGLRYFS